MSRLSYIPTLSNISLTTQNTMTTAVCELSSRAPTGGAARVSREEAVGYSGAVQPTPAALCPSQCSSGRRWRSMAASLEDDAARRAPFLRHAGRSVSLRTGRDTKQQQLATSHWHAREQARYRHCGDWLKMCRNDAQQQHLVLPWWPAIIFSWVSTRARGEREHCMILH